MRTALTVVGIALGVAAVLAIDLAGNAAAGSFRSSMETLSGDNNLEIKASGGIPEALVGIVSTLPYALRSSPRIEDFAVIHDTKQTLPLIGIDFIAEGGSFSGRTSQPGGGSNSFMDGCGNTPESADTPLTCLSDPANVWVGASLRRKPGDHISLLINDRESDYVVRGVYPDSNGAESAIVMDIAAAQRAVGRAGRVDRILLKAPVESELDKWEQRLRAVLPEGIEVRSQGAGTNENRQMLAAFRWNLKLLSYISLIVGGFLIYNTISVSVVRRRPEIGIVRSLGASRGMVLAAFLGEAASFGLIGTLLGLPLGRLMAIGTVKLVGLTVQSLYVSSRPGSIELSAASIALAFLVGIGVVIVSAYAPAREASLVPPAEAIARGRREYDVRMRSSREVIAGIFFAVAAAAASRAPAVAGKPLLGYVAALFLIVACALSIPALVNAVMRFSSSWLGRSFGAEALLASRSLSASLRRTSVLIAALATAIAMMVSIGIMVGSFRETVIAWMAEQLPADLYIRPAGDPATDRHPTISPEVVAAIAKLPGVGAIDRLRAYEITYNGRPIMLGGADLSGYRTDNHSDFFSGRRSEDVLRELRGSNGVVVSEPFTSKHHVKTGDTIALSLGEARASFRIVDVYYDYSSERGEILMDRETLLRYLPDPAPSNLAVYVAAGADGEAVRSEIVAAAAGHRLLIFSDREIRSEAIRIFDRTFAITYALEAVAVLVAVIGVAGALLALVIDRRRELGLMTFLGATTKQVRKLILVEAGLLGLLANFAGVVLGYFLSLVLIFVINKQSFGWTIRFHWPVTILLAGLTFVYAATVLSGLYPARIATRLNPVEVIHED
ncbi:MAG: ABC transporter permease [Acidobacteriota bacterium]|nr:ABC transporter permease [Acidobacteriota bacterium]